MAQLDERPATGQGDHAYTPIQLKIFRDRYGLGEEQFPHEAWMRVAGAVAGNEAVGRQEVWTNRFFDLLAGFRYVPGGRILAAMGSGAGVTAQNCYVIPSPEDSRSGIMQSLAEWVEIQSKGGGVGVNMSSLRPRNELVKGVNGTSSGPVSWSQLFAFVSHDIIIQGGSRRGAAMIMLDVEHPDIFEFIHAKEHAGVLEGCNISVCLSDSFMDAVEQDRDFDLRWQGKVYDTVKARKIWDEICQAAWRSAEPGIYFMERANKEANSGYFEQLISTNPCVTRDTWVQTSDGPRQVRELVDHAFEAVVDGQWHRSDSNGFFATGHKPVVRLSTREGQRLRLTPDHLVRTVTGKSRWRIDSQWVPAGELKPGQEIVLNNHRNAEAWDGAYAEPEGYLLGLLIGDGVLKADKAVISAWPGELVVNGGYQRPGVAGIMRAAEEAARGLPHRSDFRGWIAIPGRGEFRLSLGHVKALAASLGMAPGSKVITPAIERSSSNFYCGLLRGLFDADGSIQGSQLKGVSVRLAQSDAGLLEAAQRMLLRLGIASTVYRDRRPAGTSRLPDGHGGLADYAVRAQHELVITGDNLHVYAKKIGFADTVKTARLHAAIAGYVRQPNRERFVATVESIEPDGTEDVYDVHIPGVNAFDANGLYVHNCGEQPLGEYGACLLGSFNLAAFLTTDSNGKPRFDFEKFAQYVPYAVRFNDNVVDLSNYPLEQCSQSQHSIRRMGIGVMGLADVLLSLELRYGSLDAIAFTEQVFMTLRDESYRASVRLAEERGPFPRFIAEKYLDRPFIKRLPEDVREGIRRHGIRNCYLLTQAPTGTTSLLSGVNSGIEPYFDFDYLRSDRTGSYSVTSSWADMYATPGRPEWLVAANDISPEEHVLMQAAAQRYNDSSISKTANAPESHTVEDVRRLYMLAYHEGLKSISYYRDNSRQTQVLYHKGDKAQEVDAAAAVAEAQALLAKSMAGPKRRKLPDERQAITHKFRVGEQEGYMTVGLFDDGTPGEVFINVNKQGSTVSGLMDTVAMLTSYALQYGVPLAELASKLKNTRFEPSGPTGNPNIPIATSIIDYVFRWLELKFGGPGASGVQPTLIPADEVAISTSADTAGGKYARAIGSGVGCPECGEVLWWSEGCLSCRQCGYTKCG